MKPEIAKLLRDAESWMQAHKAEFIEEIQIWARQPSVSRADLAEVNAPFGADCRRMLDLALERGRHYGFATTDHDGYAGSIYCGDYKSSLGVIGHIDVVPVGEGWIYPQFGATYLAEHDALIGRGVGDDKGPAVAGLFAIRMLRETGWPLKHGLRLICGTSEETGMQDMQALADKGYDFPLISLVPDAGFPVNYGQKGAFDGYINAECSGNLVSFDAGMAHNVIPDKAECVIVADIDAVKSAISVLDDETKARLTVEPTEGGIHITALGKAGHAAAPDNGINAIAVLSRALTETKLLTGGCADIIRNLAELTADSHGESEGIAFTDEISGPTTLVYAVAHLTDGRLSVSVDSRTSISADQTAMLNALNADWNRRGFTSDITVTRPFYIPKDDPKVTGLMELYKEVTGRDDEAYTMGGGTYSRVVPNAISFGPGIPGDDSLAGVLPEGHGGAHGMDEIVSIDGLIKCAVIYTAALAVLDELV